MIIVVKNEMRFDGGKRKEKKERKKEFRSKREEDFTRSFISCLHLLARYEEEKK
jgi:hypothetical protein